MSLDRLLQGEIALGVLRAYRRDLTAQTRAGRRPPEHAEDVLAGLEAAAQRRAGAASSRRSGTGSVDDGSDAWVSIKTGAEAVGVSARWVEALVARGRVRSRVIDGRTKQVDLDSLRGVTAEGRSRR